MNSGMMTRLLLRSLTVRRSRALTSFLALTVAATISAALLLIFLDVNAKLTREFRRFGANVVITSSNGLTTDDVNRLATLLPAGSNYAPEIIVIAQRGDGSTVTVIGAHLAALRKMDSWWLIDGPANQPLAGSLTNLVAGETLTYQNRRLQLPALSALRSGGDEDRRLYLPLSQAAEWTQAPITVVELQVAGSASQIEAVRQQLAQQLPSARVEPVRQVAEAQGRVIASARGTLLLTSLLVIIAVFLCVSAAMTSSVLDRRRDFAVMKALGSPWSRLSLLFLGESLLLALAASVAGIILGMATATLISHADFGDWTTFRWQAVPLVVALTVILAGLSSLVPISRLRTIQPAVILKGE